MYELQPGRSVRGVLPQPPVEVLHSAGKLGTGAAIPSGPRGPRILPLLMLRRALALEPQRGGGVVHPQGVDPGGGLGDGSPLPFVEGRDGNEVDGGRGPLGPREAGPGREAPGAKQLTGPAGVVSLRPSVNLPVRLLLLGARLHPAHGLGLWVQSEGRAPFPSVPCADKTKTPSSEPSTCYNGNDESIPFAHTGRVSVDVRLYKTETRS